MGCDYSLPTLPSDHIPHQPVPESRHTQVADCDNRWNSGVFNLMQSDYLGHILLLITGTLSFKMRCEGVPGGAVVENLPANAGDMGSSPDLGKSHMPRSN